MSYVKSPKTNRAIKVGGDTWEKLEREGWDLRNLEKTTRRSPKRKARRARSPTRRTRSPTRRTRSPTKTKGTRLPNKNRVMNLPVAHPSPLRDTLQRLPATRKYRRKMLKRQMPYQDKSRGMSTRGWAAASPQRGRERRALMDQCGEACFLQPETQKFPVCAALREGQGCALDCRGLQAAYNRARQHKYNEVASFAKEILDKKCR